MREGHTTAGYDVSIGKCLDEADDRSGRKSDELLHRAM